MAHHHLSDFQSELTHSVLRERRSVCSALDVYVYVVQLHPIYLCLCPTTSGHELQGTSTDD